MFAGGCDLAAAEAVLADDDLDAIDVADELGQLVDKSLVVADEDDDGVRYRLLESIRQYAQEQLQASGETAAVRRRHADYYVAWSEAAGPHLRGRDHLPWTKVAVRNVDNFRAASGLGGRGTVARARAAPGRANEPPRQRRRARAGLGGHRVRDSGRRRSPALSGGRGLGVVERHPRARFRAGRSSPRSRSGRRTG